MSPSKFGFHGVCRLTSLFPWRVSPFEFVFMACVAVCTSFVRLYRLLRLVFITCVALQLVFMACVAFRLVSVASVAFEIVLSASVAVRSSFLGVCSLQVCFHGVCRP